MKKGLENLSCEEKLRSGAAQPGGEEAQEGLINVYKFPKGTCKEPSARTAGIEHKLGHGRFHLTVRKHFFTV